MTFKITNQHFQVTSNFLNKHPTHVAAARLNSVDTRRRMNGYKMSRRGRRRCKDNLKMLKQRRVSTGKETEAYSTFEVFPKRLLHVDSQQKDFKNSFSHTKVIHFLKKFHGLKL